MKTYNKRADIPEKYKWDLKSILKNKDESFYLDEIKRLGKYLTENKDIYLKNIDSFKLYLDKENELTTNKFIYSNWLSNNISVNIVDDKFRKLDEEFNFWNYNYSKEHANDVNFILKNKSVISEYLKNEWFREYRFSYQNIFEKKKHILSEKEELLLSKVARAFNDNENQFSILSNVELKYNDVRDSKNKSHKLNNGNYSVLIKNKDSVLRKNTYNEFWDKHLDHKESFAAMLYEHKKAESVIANIRNYKSSVAMLTDPDFVEEKLLKNIYNIVSEKSYIVDKFNKAWKKNYQTKFKTKANIWDRGIELISINNKYTVEDAKEIVIESLKPFGDEYISMINKAFNDRWIDFMPVNNKRTGAYSIGATYGVDKKYICMNFDEQFRSVETLTHELGHSMHSYYSDKNNTLIESQYEILVAEIASTFNELMLADHMLNNSHSDKEKMFIIEQLITGFIGAIHRQTIWSEYEFELYKAIDEGKPINTHESQMKIYNMVSEKYSKVKAKKDNKSKKAASFYVPHYYYGFYVYKYALGLAATYSFFANYKKSGKKALEKYVKSFLSEGGKGKPIERLKGAGVDLSDPNVLYSAFDVFEGYVNEYILLSKKVFS